MALGSCHPLGPRCPRKTAMVSAGNVDLGSLQILLWVRDRAGGKEDSHCRAGQKASPPGTVVILRTEGHRAEQMGTAAPPSLGCSGRDRQTLRFSSVGPSWVKP